MLKTGDLCRCGAALPWEKQKLACAMMTVDCACGRTFRFVDGGLKQERQQAPIEARKQQAMGLAKAFGKAIEQSSSREEILANLDRAYPSWRSQLREL